MKVKITRKSVKCLFNKVLYCGYCDLQNIMRGVETRFYNCGIYGWNYDVYDLGVIGITTGYRGMFGKRIPTELIEKYDKEAKEIIESNLSWKNHDEYVAKMNDIRDRFINELKNL